MGVSERLKSFREDSGLTQEAVAKKIGVTKQTIHKYESGIVKNIPLKNIEKLAKLYNIKPSQITRWVDEDNKTESAKTIIDSMEYNELKELYNYIENKLNPSRKDMIIWLNDNIKHASSSGQNYEMMTDEELRSFYETIRQEKEGN